MQQPCTTPFTSLQITLNELWKNQISPITEQFSSFTERVQKIVEPVCELSQRLSFIFQSISWIRFEHSYKIPEKPAIEPEVLFRASEHDVRNRFFSLKTEVYDDARRRVEYQQLIEEDVNWGIAVWLISRYESTKLWIDEKYHPGRRLLQWIHGLRTSRTLAVF